MTDTPTERDQSIWTRLRRRKVVQWSVAYVAAAWALLQGIDFLVDAFHWSDATKQIATIALAIGLPVVLVVAWFHGDRGQQRVGGTELTIVAALLALGGFLLWRYEPTTAPTATATIPVPVLVRPTQKSIAVLPFADMSPQKDQEYMADGVAEELLILLGKIPELRVIGRTSSFQFKGKNEDLRVIGQKLGVAHLLEGSVRKSGDKIRLTAQLIRADDGTHLWSETYDRTLDDIFLVQDEIAGEVVKALKVTLLGAAPTVRETNPEAYAMFLQARLLGRHTTAEAFKQSDALYKKVLALDPAYAPAWNGLSRNYSNEPAIGMRSYEEGSRLAREAANKALAIDPEYAPAHARLAYLATLQGDLAGAARHYERALALNPFDLDVLRNAGDLLQPLGRLKDAIALQEYIVVHDPVNVVALYNLSVLYIFADRFDEAIALLRTALSLAPGKGGAHYTISVAQLLKGQSEAALAELQRETSEVWRMIGLPMVYHALGRTADSDAALAALESKYAKEWAYNIAYVHAFRGDTDEAFEWLDMAAEYGDPGLVDTPLDNLFANLHEDPRWLLFLRKHGMAPEQLAAIKFDVKVPN